MCLFCVKNHEVFEGFGLIDPYISSIKQISLNSMRIKKGLTLI